MSTPWKTENWFVSPWNYLKEVTKDFHPPEEGDGSRCHAP